MKKFLDFISSFVLPKKMMRYRNINFFIIVLIFLGCMFLCVGTSNLGLTRYIKNNKDSFRLFNEVYDLSSEEKVNLPRFSIDESKSVITNFTIGEEVDNVYELSFPLEDNKTLNLTLVYEPNVKINDECYKCSDISSHCANCSIVDTNPKQVMMTRLLLTMIVF